MIPEFTENGISIYENISKGERTMKIKKATWIVGMTAIVAVGFISMVGARKMRAASPRDPPPGGKEVKIDNLQFGPKTVTVGGGATGTWTNKDDVPHTGVKDDKAPFKTEA